jgi:hypothetical protein
MPITSRGLEWVRTQTYRAAFMARVVQRLMGPRAVSANTLAATVAVSQETRSRWLRQARSVEGMSSPKKG